jgi:hypothetical protein
VLITVLDTFTYIGLFSQQSSEVRNSVSLFYRQIRHGFRDLPEVTDPTCRQPGLWVPMLTPGSLTARLQRWDPRDDFHTVDQSVLNQIFQRWRPLAACLSPRT